MAKTFEAKAAKMPRSARKDPAFAAAADAVADLGLNGSPTPEAAPPPALPVAVSPEPSPVVPAAEVGERAAPPEPIPPAISPTTVPAEAAAPPAVMPASPDGIAAGEPLDPRDAKVTIYPAERELRHLRELAAHGRVAKSIIAEYALEVLFRTEQDEQIVGELRARGHGLRKKRGS